MVRQVQAHTCQILLLTSMHCCQPEWAIRATVNINKETVLWMGRPNRRIKFVDLLEPIFKVLNVIHVM